MARAPTTTEQELPAYPIRAYQLIPDPNQPTVVALAIETDQGHSLFLATRQILEDLGQRSAGAGREDAGQIGIDGYDLAASWFVTTARFITIGLKCAAKASLASHLCDIAIANHPESESVHCPTPSIS